MDPPRISVIIPAYNHERFIGPAIESVRAQSWTDWELVVVDDGSTDGTGAVVQGFDDPRIHYHHQSNQDAFNAINHGFALARGTWFSILNSDDLYHPKRLESCLIAAQAGADVVFTDVVPVDADGQEIPVGTHYWHAWHARNRATYAATGDLATTFLQGNLMVGTSNLFLRAETARAVGGFAPLRYLHDYEYMFRLLLAEPERIRYLADQPLVRYRIHGGNTLKQGAITAREQDLALIQKYLPLLLCEPDAVRAATALDRITELHHELEQVRRAVRWGRARPWIERALRLRHRLAHCRRQA